jgi:RAP domain
MLSVIASTRDWISSTTRTSGCALYSRSTVRSILLLRSSPCFSSYFHQQRTRRTTGTISSLLLPSPLPAAGAQYYYSTSSSNGALSSPRIHSSLLYSSLSIPTVLHSIPRSKKIASASASAKRRRRDDDAATASACCFSSRAAAARQGPQAVAAPASEAERAIKASAASDTDGALIISAGQQQQQQHATLKQSKPHHQRHHHHLHRSIAERQRQQHNNNNPHRFLTVQHVLKGYMKRREQQQQHPLQPYQVAFVWSNLRKAVENQIRNSKTWNENDSSLCFWTSHDEEVQTLLVHSLQLVQDGWDERATATVTHSLAKLLDLTTRGGSGGDRGSNGDGTLTADQQQQQQQQQQQRGNNSSSKALIESLWDALLLRSMTLLEASLSTSSSSRDDNNFNAVEVSNLWWAYAKVASIMSRQRTMVHLVTLLSPPPERLLNALSSTALGCLDEFAPQGLSNVAWAIATLNCQRPLPPLSSSSSLLNAIAQTAQVRMDQFNPQELSNLIWAFATLKHNGPLLLDAVASRVIHTDGILDDFTPQALANTAWAFATFHHHHPLLFDAIARAAQARIDLFKAQELSSIAWAFATVKQPKQQPTRPALLCAIASAAQVRMDDFNPQALSNAAWAFATLGQEAPALFGAIAKSAGLQIQHFSPQALSNTAYAFAKVNHAEPALFQAIAQAARLRLGDFKPQEIANLTWAFATFNYKDLLLLKDICATAEAASWSNFTAHGMANMAWSFAVFNDVENENASCSFVTSPNSSFAQTLLSIMNDDADNDSSFNSHLTAESLCQFYQLGLWCKEQNAVATAGDDVVDWFPNDLSRRCKEAFVSMAVPAEPSVLQNDVVTTLATLPDVSHVEVEVLTEIGYRLDAVVTLRRGGDRLIGVEVDGPSHFVGQTQSPNGRTVLKQRQLRTLEGWKLVSVPYWEWNKILQFSDGHANMKVQKQRYLQELLHQAVRE